MSLLRTSIEIGSGVDDYDLPIEIKYSIHPGCKTTSASPAEETTAEIESIVVIDAQGRRHEAGWLCDLLADDEDLLSLCILDWQEDCVAQEEYRAEAIREERMLGDR